MKLNVVFVLVLAACQPQVASRSVSSSGLSGGDGLKGTWLSDSTACGGIDGEQCQIRITETSLRISPLNGAGANRQIKFLSQNTFYDYHSEETVEFSVNGNRANLCWDIGCNALTRQ